MVRLDGEWEGGYFVVCENIDKAFFYGDFFGVWVGVKASCFYDELLFFVGAFKGDYVFILGSDGLVSAVDKELFV